MAGFAHPLIFVVMIIGIIGLLFFTGRRVWIKTNEAQSYSKSKSTPTAATSGSSAPTTSDDTHTVTLNKTGTAAQTRSKSTTTTTAKTSTTSSTSPEQVKIATGNNIKTPEGSFKQLVIELKAKNINAAMYFVTPRLIDKATSLLQLAEPITIDQCRANPQCNTALNTDVSAFNLSAIYSYSVSGKSLVYNVRLNDGTNHKITIDMVDNHTNWAVDRITVDGYTI
jgi:hypothetical protein